MLRSAYHGMTKVEKRIANYIMLNPETVMDMTIPALAQAVSSSEITVSRFCKKLGFNGLQSLKIALAADLRQMRADGYPEIRPGDSYETVTAKVFQSIADGLSDTQKLLDFRAAEKAVDILIKARRIAVYGFGNSATVCRDIETRFLRFGMVVQAYSDSHQQVTSASLLTSNDAVIAVSHTGATSELLTSTRLARANGARVIAITSHAASPLTKEADVVLVGMGREVHYCSEAAASRLVHMAMVDVLYTGIAMRMPDQYQENLHRMRKAIAEKRV